MTAALVAELHYHHATDGKPGQRTRPPCICERPTEPSRPTASHAAFAADLARFDAAFRSADAIVTDDDGWQGIDTSKVAPELLSAYQRLVEYGYANGLMP